MLSGRKAWYPGEMALTESDLSALGVLFDDKLESRLAPLEARIDALHRDMNDRFETLFSRDETRAQEYELLTAQMTRLEERVTALEKKAA